MPQVDPPVQPAGYAFSIWGVIYLWLIAHGGYGLLQRADDTGWDATRWPLIVSLAVGASWIPVAQVSPVWALILIWVMLIGALWALFHAPGREAVWLAAPIGLYAGWLSAASWVSVAINGAGYGLGPGALGWAWIAVAALFAMAGAVQWRLGRVPTYGLAVAWALVAVAVQNWGVNTGLTVLAILGAAAFAVVPFRLPART